MMKKIELVADIGINHNGILGLAIAMIDDAVEAGFDYVKFQKRNVKLTTPPDRWEEIKDTPWGVKTYLEYKEQLELSGEEYDRIDSYCKQKGINGYKHNWRSKQ